MNIHREGHGPPLLLIHGVGHHWQAWQPVIPQLAQSSDVIACDSPGFGASAPLRHAGPPTIPAYADAFASLVRELGVERPHVAGNSMGGAIALELARRGAVASVSAFSPAGFWTDAERWYCQRSLGLVGRLPRAIRPGVRTLVRTRAGRAGLLAQLIARPTALEPAAAVASLDALWGAPALLPALGAFSHYRCAPPPEPFDAPITVAWGNRDRLLPYRLQAPRARRILPFANHVTLDAGHLPFTDDPAGVVDVIRSTAARAGAPGVQPTAGRRPASG